MTAIALLWSCGGSKTESASSADSSATAPANKVEAVGNITGDVVCVWEGNPVYAEPKKGAKYMTGLSLGETVKYLSEVTTDATDNNREYIKIELFDGKTGWAPTYGLVRESKLGVIIRELSTVYKRPQLAAITNTKLKMMDIVAVGKQEQNFVEVTGAKKQVTGWVHPEDITTKEDDVTAALMAIKIIPADAKGDALEAKLKEFLDAAPSGSAFYNRLNDQYNAILAGKEQVVATDSAASGN